jgi:pimeloyl-ACP methyl ester carboxylesterase
MSFITIKNIRIYYEIHGTGDTIVLLHHGFGCTKMWEQIYPAFVENGYKVIMYDRRGYGKSERGSDFGQFYISGGFRHGSLEEMVLLMKSLEINSFHIVGQCEGGIIGVDYALKYPDQVKTIVTSNTGCYSKINMPELVKLKLPQPFKELDPELKEKLIIWHGKDYAETFYNIYRKGGGAYGTGIYDLRGFLPLIKCPALVLFSDRSHFFDVEQGVEFYRHLVDGELAVLPKCGHNTYEQQPEEYVRHISLFLKRH